MRINVSVPPPRKLPCHEDRLVLTARLNGFIPVQSSASGLGVLLGDELFAFDAGREPITPNDIEEIEDSLVAKYVPARLPREALFPSFKLHAENSTTFQKPGGTFKNTALRSLDVNLDQGHSNFRCVKNI